MLCLHAANTYLLLSLLLLLLCMALVSFNPGTPTVHSTRVMIANVTKWLLVRLLLLLLLLCCCCCRALVFINPGNPTGQCLGGEEVKRLVEWCAANRVVLLADEVYQELVYNPDK
jgi:hypothetical protein